LSEAFKGRSRRREKLANFPSESRRRMLLQFVMENELMATAAVQGGLDSGPSFERRAELEHLVGDDADSRIQFSDEFDDDGAALFKACAERALEGIVSKHALAPCRSGRSRTWLRPSALSNSPSWWWVQTATARPAHSWRSSRTAKLRRSGIHHAWW
jgi:hypothetical protein